MQESTGRDRPGGAAGQALYSINRLGTIAQRTESLSAKALARIVLLLGAGDLLASAPVHFLHRADRKRSVADSLTLLNFPSMSVAGPNLGCSSQRPRPAEIRLD